MKLKKFPILVIVLVIFLVIIFVIGGINEKIQLQLDPLATILAVMGIGYTWWVDQNYQKSSIEGLLLNEMITRQSFKIRKKSDQREFFCTIRFDERTDRWSLRLRNLDESTFEYGQEGVTKLERNELHHNYSHSKIRLVSYITESFDVVGFL